MTAICGMAGRHEVPAGGVDAMLDAMACHGAGGASWTGAGAGLGSRYIDMPRLVEHPGDPALSGKPRVWSGLGRALSILDFH